MPTTPYEYQGTLVRAVDGDTVVLHLEKDFVLPVDFGFYIKDEVHLHKTTEQKFRLFGINTPEVVGEQKPLGLAAKAALEQRLASCVGPLRIVSYRGDKFGRWLATIFVKDEAGVETEVNQWMVEQGYAKPYFGEGPKPV